mmetsp:Transcript_29410/g.71033  ORF Transcript_29410/g.71033 Transcript_29410/m.71033 type:complete len:206 (-) Transcript_29410:57-674(-)
MSVLRPPLARCPPVISSAASVAIVRPILRWMPEGSATYTAGLRRGGGRTDRPRWRVGRGCGGGMRRGGSGEEGIRGGRIGDDPPSDRWHSVVWQMTYHRPSFCCRPLVEMGWTNCSTSSKGRPPPNISPTSNAERTRAAATPPCHPPLPPWSNRTSSTMRSTFRTPPRPRSREAASRAASVPGRMPPWACSREAIRIGGRSTSPD